MSIRVFTIHPTNPSDELWQLRLDTTPDTSEDD
jgi:hypothetical protein